MLKLNFYLKKKIKQKIEGLSQVFTKVRLISERSLKKRNREYQWVADEETAIDTDICVKTVPQLFQLGLNVQ